MRSQGLPLAGIVIALAGCGRPDEPAPAQNQPAPVESDDPAAIGSKLPLALDAETRAEVLAQGRALQLDTLLVADAEPRLPSRATIAEPLRPILRATPELLLASARDVLAAKDLAALARLVDSPERKPVLTERDARDAERRFLGPATHVYWERLLAAVGRGSVEVVSQGAAEAVLQIDVGGAAGAYTLRLRREESGWYLSS